MPATKTPSSKSFRNGSTAGSSPKSSGGRGQGAKPQGEVVHTLVFDSIGPRKYALQIRKASNGNPCLKFVEGVPQGDGTFRKFHLTVWSEDFERFFSVLDEMRAYMAEHNIKTPEGHKYDPNKKPKRKRGVRE